MTYEDLLQLFYDGQLEEIITKGEIYSFSNPDDLDALFLQAVAHHDIVAYNRNEEEIFLAIQNDVLPILRKGIEKDPNNGRFLYNFLNYAVGNQTTLRQLNLTHTHITEHTKDEYIDYAKRLTQLEGSEVYGYDFLARIYELLDDKLELLDAYNLFLEKNDILFANDRESRDINFAVYFPKKVFLLEDMKLSSGAELVTLVEDNIWRFDTDNNYSFLDFADLAKENNRLDVAVKLLYKLVAGESVETFYYERVKNWYQFLKSEFENGWENPEVINFILTTERFLEEQLEFEKDQYFKTARQIEQKYREDPSVLLYLGTYYYEEGEYTKALLPFEKLLNIQPNIRAWRRYVECRYNAFQHLEDQMPRFEIPKGDHPNDLYNQGVLFDGFATKLPDDVRKTYKGFLAQIYQQSWDESKDYLDHNQYETSHLPMRHMRAMCGNNLAIVLHEYFEEYDKALQIIEESKDYSLFAELFLTELNIYKKKGEHENVIKTAEKYFESHIYYPNNVYNIRFESNMLASRVALGEAFSLDFLKEKLFQFYEFDDYANVEDTDEVLHLDHAYNGVEDLIYQKLEDEDVDVRLNHHKKIIERFPDQPNSYYHLAQISNEIEDFETCEWAAKEYFRTKRIEAFSESNWEKIHFLLVKSKAFQEKYEDAIQYFEDNYGEIKAVMQPSSWIYTVSIILPSYVNTERYDKVFQLSDEALELYKQEQIDDLYSYEKILISKAISLQNLGKTKEALAIVDYLMKYDNYDPILDEYKRDWKPKGGFFGRFF